MDQQNGLYHAAIVGANGYSGRELARILLQHPHVKLTTAFTRDKNWRLSDELPEKKAQAVNSLPLDDLAKEASNINTLFLATPHEASMELVAKYAKIIPNIIDLSGAFRLEAEQYPTWYDLTHSASELLNSAVYGLSPWQQKHSGKPTNSHTLIANPGCYATCVLMALLPLLKNHLIEPNHIIIDAKSGLTGAGRKPKANLLLAEISQDFYPYKIAEHQHQPEITRHINTFTEQTVDLTLMTHLLPIKRGISASIYVNLTSKMQQQSVEKALECIKQSFDQAYADYPLIEYGHIKSLNSQFLSLNKVVGSCRTHVAYEVKNGKLFLFSTIDNLLKGAASQAVENFNWIQGLPLDTALLHKEGVL